MENTLHPWNLTPTEAIALQKKLRSEITLQTLPGKVEFIGGADISFNKFSEIVYAGIVVLRYPSLELYTHSAVISKSTFPYIPGLLSFREIPALLEAWNLLEKKPDVLMVDGHGIAHPRRMGIAAHFGLVTKWPTMGCAKKVLTGKYKEPEMEKGSYTPLTDGEERIGIMLRTKNKVKPVIVSPGNLLSFENALEITLNSLTTYRLPEPTRQAHLLVNKLRLGEITPGLHTYTNINRQGKLF